PGDFVVALLERDLKLVQERAALLAFPLQLGSADGVVAQCFAKRFDHTLLQVAELIRGERWAPLHTSVIVVGLCQQGLTSREQPEQRIKLDLYLPVATVCTHSFAALCQQPLELGQLLAMLFEHRPPGGERLATLVE